jgi:hypothetical protein
MHKVQTLPAPALLATALAAAALAAVLAATVLVAGCRGDARSPSTPSADAAPIVDPTKAYLTDDKMTRFVDSMRAEANPFDFLFRMNSGDEAAKPHAQLGSERLAQLDGFARKFGLAGAEEYFQIWTRIMLAEMSELAESARQMGDEAAALLEKRLQRPDLPETERQDLQKQLEQVKERFAAEDVRGATLNSADLEVVRKYKGDIDEALKRWNP